VHALSAERPETAAEWDATAIFVFALIACFARPAQMLSVHARRSNYGRGWQKPSLSEVLLAYLRAARRRWRPTAAVNRGDDDLLWLSTGMCGRISTASPVLWRRHSR